MMTTADHEHRHVLGEATIGELRAQLRGVVITPHDNGYDAARRVWNGMIDRHPSLIVRCAGVADVISAIQFARSQELPVAIRGGGHNVAGHAVCDGGLVVDLSAMKAIRVDSERQVARAEPGLTWNEFDRETQAFGLATTGGLVSTTGIAGFTLGGGIGWLMRKHGLTCDHLLSADVVTADGQFLTASPTEHTDLFWGIRGGGGNFGVVTSFAYQLHPVGPVLGGMVLHPAASARKLLRFYREFTATAPAELTTLAAFITAPPAPFLPTHLHGQPMIGIIACYAGPVDDGEVAIQPLRTFGPPAFAHLGPLPYCALQTMLDAAAPSGLQNYWKSAYLSNLDDSVIDTIIAHAGTMGKPFSAIHLHHLQGAVSRVAGDQSAFAHRDASFVLNIVAMWQDPAENDQHIAWARTFAQAIEPYAAGVYVNFLGNEGAERVKAAYGTNYARLADLKRAYDPTNFFHFNQNIPPATH